MLGKLKQQISQRLEEVEQPSGIREFFHLSAVRVLALAFTSRLREVTAVIRRGRFHRGVMIYSVGPDGVDDQGAPWNLAKRRYSMVSPILKNSARA